MNLLFAFAPPDALVAHAPALMIAVPILLASLIIILRLPGAITALMAMGANLWLAMGLIARTYPDRHIEYAFGSWDAPIGIVFHIDALNAMIALIIAGIGFLCALGNMVMVNRTLPQAQAEQAHAGILLCIAGLLGVVLTGDVFNLFVFIEISSLSAYALIALGGQHDRRALRAAFNYLIIGSIGATFYLIGIGFLYAATGTLNMQDMATRLAALEDNRAIMAGLVFVTTGLGLKAALFPLHVWLPNAYAYAPGFVTALMSATATKAAIYALARFLFGVFSPDDVPVQIMLTQILAPLAGVGILVCSVLALIKSDVRHILAWSSIAQSGYMLLALALGSLSGMVAALLHMFAHASMKSALFMALGPTPPGPAGLDLSRLYGAGQTAPVSMGVFTLCGLSLAGMPLTLGFASKWVLLSAVTEAQWYWATALVAISSILGFLYVGRMLRAIYSPPEHTGNALRIHDGSLALLLPLLTLAVANFAFGLRAALPLELAHNGAAILFPHDQTGRLE